MSMVRTNLAIVLGVFCRQAVGCVGLRRVANCEVLGRFMTGRGSGLSWAQVCQGLAFARMMCIGNDFLARCKPYHLTTMSLNGARRFIIVTRMISCTYKLRPERLFKMPNTMAMSFWTFTAGFYLNR